MNVMNIVGKMKERFHSAQEKLALTILIWLEKEPSQERVLSAAAAGDNNGPYIRYRERSRLRMGRAAHERLREEEKVA
jgi:hypothetical protein